MKKLISLILALVMVMGLAVGVSAQTVGVATDGTGSITISNASKGETYSVYKLFDATVTGTEGGSIAYSGEIPESLEAYFTEDAAGNISVVENVNEEDLFTALKTWAASATAAASAENTDGAAMVFAGLKYGYYVITSSQGEAAITVTSTNPNAVVVDKNVSLPTAPVKKVNGKDTDDVMIGEMVTYTVTFDAANYEGEGVNAKKITSYIIEDDLPAFLTGADVTDIKVEGVPVDVVEFSDNKIVIPWVDDEANSLYANGATVEITYTATVDKDAVCGEANTNTVTLSWASGNETFGDQSVYKDTASVFTYEFDLVKTDGDKALLEGAEFQLYTVDPTNDSTAEPMALAEVTGGYRAPDASDKTTIDTIVVTDGKITVSGLKSGTYYLVETAAPQGYNMLTEPEDFEIGNENLKATVSDTTYVDGGVQVVNLTGSKLPSTGGIGTTLFYVIGGLLMTGAAVLLITKKRMA